MKFNDTVMQQIEKLESAIDERLYAIRRLNEELEANSHQCDCEYCGLENEQTDRCDSEIEDEIKKINSEVNELSLTLKRLKQYATDRNIRLKARLIASTRV